MNNEFDDYWDGMTKHLSWLNTEITTTLDKIKEVIEKSKEQLKPKDWEVVAYEFRNEIWGKTNTGLFELDNCNSEWRESAFKDKETKIHSVRRLTDNSVWSVGEMVFSDRDESLVIKAFEISDIWEGGIKVVYGNSYGIGFSLIKKAKPKLSTEEKIISLLSETLELAKEKLNQ